jgi:hypothetical protein
MSQAQEIKLLILPPLPSQNLAGWYTGSTKYESQDDLLAILVKACCDFPVSSGKSRIVSSNRT